MPLEAADVVHLPLNDCQFIRFTQNSVSTCMASDEDSYRKVPLLVVLLQVGGTSACLREFMRSVPPLQLTYCAPGVIASCDNRRLCILKALLAYMLAHGGATVGTLSCEPDIVDVRAPMIPVVLVSDAGDPAQCSHEVDGECASGGEEQDVALRVSSRDTLTRYLPNFDEGSATCVGYSVALLEMAARTMRKRRLSRRRVVTAFGAL
jgi:hypothetical protein